MRRLKAQISAILFIAIVLNGAFALADEPPAEAALLAHWTFDEASVSTIVHDTAGAPALDIKTVPIPRVPGVHGNAIVLDAPEKLAVDLGPRLAGASAVPFSVWIKPVHLPSWVFMYVLGQDCLEGVSLSFWHTELNFRLHFGDQMGVCAAKFAPDDLFDGRWHHWANTYDGNLMRIYLDGAEIGSLERSGKLMVSESVPVLIGAVREEGATKGEAAQFNGALDDLRVYDGALSPEDVASLYVEGVESLAQLSDEETGQLAEAFEARDSFAETLGNVRGNSALSEIPLSSGAAELAAARVRVQFPREYREFREWTDVHPAQYLASEDAAISNKLAGRLVAMLLEYRPLTENQWARQSAEEIERWDKLTAIEDRFKDLQRAGTEQRHSVEWLRLIMECGSKIDFRPVVQEPVAPYVTPSTPETQDLTDEEARAALERDWLHQAGGNPSPERIQDEIGWARQLAARIQAAHPQEVDFTEHLRRLDELETLAAGLASADVDLYFRVREVKRQLMLANPVVDFDRVLFVDMPLPQGSERGHEARHRLGYMAVPGGRLLILDGLWPRGKLTQLMPQPPLHGSFWRPDVSWDGTKILFCFKPHNEKSFHLYEINVDGTGLTQLTDGPYDDFDPIYLPDDEHIIFSTTRGHTYIRCMPPTNAYVLARCDRDGKNIYLISRGNETDYLPSMLNDGRVIYTRWEYTDKPLWRAQCLWTVRPDGTQANTFWGNQSVWPDLLKDARAIPGSNRVMFTGSAHHGWFAGCVGIIDPDAGTNFPDGLTKVTADLEWPESGNGPVDPVESPDYHASGSYGPYYSPYPLSEQDFIVSARRGGYPNFALFLMDVDGNRELIYEGVNNIFHAIPLKPRVKPPVLADTVAWPGPEDRRNPKPGVMYSNDVYQGVPEKLRGLAKYLRVFRMEHKTYTYWHLRAWEHSGPVISGVQADAVKWILGTVPIEADGSVSFRAPSGVPLYFQLLDEDYRALQTMRSFTGVMPGERRGCLGCHERSIAAPAVGRPSIAGSKPPRDITPPPWGVDSVSFPRYVRPALDRYCGACHQGEGAARETLDMTPRPWILGFDETYWLFTGTGLHADGFRYWHGRPYKWPEDPKPGFGIAGMFWVEGYDRCDPVAYQTTEPMTKLSYTSKLIEIASSGEHYGVRLDPVSLRKLIVWVDAMCPYRGSPEVREIPDPEFQGIDWLAIRPKIENAPDIVRPGPMD